MRPETTGFTSLCVKQPVMTRDLTEVSDTTITAEAKTGGDARQSCQDNVQEIVEKLRFNRKCQVLCGEAKMKQLFLHKKTKD